MLDFNRMLNINNKNRESEIKDIVKNEINNIKNENLSYDGICKIMANNIKYELNQLGIKSYYIDLNDYGVDHVVLISEFYDNEMKRYLIDPTISQFKINVASLMKNKDLILNLIENGYTYINDELFSDYLTMFSGKKIDIKLDEYLYDLIDIKK